MKTHFSTKYAAILEQIEALDPIQYAKTRNYTDGKVSYLSPYISRGVISTKQVLQSLLKRGYEAKNIEALVKELAWRDYFQRVWQEKNIDTEIKKQQEKVQNYEIPLAVWQAKTGIEGIDVAIQNLYQTGYMHNHCRMYVASVVCNVAAYHWKNPAQWLYYYLLDGDWASNSCSWQWVAGTNSSKKYFANQENISKYTNLPQKGTFLDLDYENLENITSPSHLKSSQKFAEKTILPKPKELQIDIHSPTFVYNYYNLDPLWHKGEKGNRVLLLESSVFERYPISEKCVTFMVDLSQNIENIQIYVGEFADLKEQVKAEIYFKEHPLNAHYQGIMEKREWINEQISGYYPSFFAYWKVVEKAGFGHL